jgi:hypothetical protein
VSNEWRAEITVFEKSGGPLTKRIALLDGKIVNDSSACRMANGHARRVKIDDIQALADLINSFNSSEAYALGRLKEGLPDQVRVVRADILNGADYPSVIARTLEYLTFNEGEPGLVLLDADFKGMSDSAMRRMEECDGLWGALCEVLPAFESVACVERASTSSGLRNKETGESFPGSGGRHLVIPILDAADIPRFLSDLHARCWLNGFGWGPRARSSNALLSTKHAARPSGSSSKVLRSSFHRLSKNAATLSLMTAPCWTCGYASR